MFQENADERFQRQLDVENLTIPGCESMMVSFVSILVTEEIPLGPPTLTLNRKIEKPDLFDNSNLIFMPSKTSNIV